MKTIEQWFEEYEASHKNHTNKAIHFVCVPSIFVSILGFLYCLKLPFEVMGIQLNVATLASILVVLYYFRLSPSIAVGVLLICVVGIVIWRLVESAGLYVWLIALIVFVIAWVGQFIGHGIEKQRPSFLKDLQFLLIGPAWILSFVYKKLGIRI